MTAGPLLEPSSADRVDPHQVHPAARNPADRLAWHEQSRILAAAHAAKRRYPGAVGEVLHRELVDWSDFGHRLGGHGLVMRLVDDLMKPAD